MLPPAFIYGLSKCCVNSEGLPEALVEKRLNLEDEAVLRRFILLGKIYLLDEFSSGFYAFWNELVMQRAQTARVSDDT